MIKTIINKDRPLTQEPFDTYAIEDYKELYFEAMSKIRQLSSIENLLHGTMKTVNNIEIKDIISEHEKNIMILEKELKEKDKVYANLQEEIKKERESFSEKEDYLKQKIEVEIRKKNVVIDELDLAKGELRICKKEMENLKRENEKLQKVVENFTQNESEHKEIDLSETEMERFNNDYKLLIKRQYNEIYELENEIFSLKETNEQSINRMDKLKEQMKSLTEIHEMENESKLRIIKNLEKDLKNKSKRIKELEKTENINIEENSKENDLKMKNNKEKTINEKENLIERLKNKIFQYEQLFDSYEQNEKQIYSELMKKDVEIEEFEEKEKKYVKKIQELKEIIMEFKTSYIHAELQKSDLIEKYKKEQKSLKASRLSRVSNISTTKLNKTFFNNTTICDNTTSSSTTLTPLSSLNNSRVIKFNDNNFDKYSELEKENGLKSKQGNLTTKNKLNEIKSSFYKNKTPKTHNSRKSSQITPFEI